MTELLEKPSLSMVDVFTGNREIAAKRVSFGLSELEEYNSKSVLVVASVWCFLFITETSLDLSDLSLSRLITVMYIFMKVTKITIF